MVSETPDPSAALERARARAGPRLPQAVDSAKRAHEIGREFEAHFLGQVFQNMFRGLESDGFFGGGQGEAVFRDFMADEMGRIVTRRGGVGLAEEVASLLMARQEQAAGDAVEGVSTAPQISREAAIEHFHRAAEAQAEYVDEEPLE